MRGLKAFLAMEFRLAFREPLTLVFTLLFPGASYLLFGLLYGGMRYGAQGSSFYDSYTASFIGVVVLTIALFGLGPGIVVLRELGVYKRLIVTPLNPSVILIATVTRAIAIVCIGLVEMTLIGYLMFDRLPPPHFGQFVLALVLSAACMFSFAFLLASLVKKSGTAFGVNSLLFQPMLLLSGASVPLEMFPRAARAVSTVIPMTYVVDALRSGWAGQLWTADALLPVAVLIGITALCVALTNRVFRWTAV